MPQSHGCARLGAVPWRAEVALDDGAEPHANRDAFPARVLTGWCAIEVGACLPGAFVW